MWTLAEVIYETICRGIFLQRIFYDWSQLACNASTMIVLTVNVGARLTYSALVLFTPAEHLLQNN